MAQNQDVLMFVANKKQVRLKDVSTEFNISYQAASNHLNKLCRKPLYFNGRVYKVKPKDKGRIGSKWDQVYELED